MAEATRKVCVLGHYAVGKTSLVARYVHQVFSDKYLTTVGVKIDTKHVEAPDGKAVDLVIWDVADSYNFSDLGQRYLRGAAGYLLVVDGTRAETLDTARRIRQSAGEQLGDAPCVCLINKSDLVNEWELKPEIFDQLAADGWTVFHTSAKTGENVESAFQALAAAVLDA